MKKILSLLGAIGMIATTATTVVACGKGDANANQDWMVRQPIRQIINQDLSKYVSETITIEEVVEEGKTGLVEEAEVLWNPGETKANWIHLMASKAGTITINLVGQPKEDTTSQNAPQDPLHKKKILKLLPL